jgi:type I restriction enzyme S subunit
VRGDFAKDQGAALKKGWQTKTLGEVLEKTETVNPLQSPNAEFDYIDVSSVSNTTFEIQETQRLKGKDAPSRARKLVRTNDIIFATIRPTLQRIAVVPEHLDKQVCSTGYFVLRPKQGIDHRFVFYSLLTENFTGQMESLQKGASYPAVTDGDVRAQEIPVPPLAEQQRIVGLLDEAFEGLATAKANAEKNLQNARALFESHLQSVFTQRDPGWVEHTLGDLIEIQNGYAFKSTDYTDAGYFVIRISNVQDGEITLANPRFIKLADKKLERFILNDGDILISLTGNIGRVGIIQEDQLPAVLNQRVARITVKDRSADRDFLFRFLSSRTFRESLQEAGHGAAQQNVSTKEIEAVRLSLPNKKEQRRIVEEFDNFAEETQRLTRLYEQKHAALEALKKSLLHQAFSGEL